MSPVASAAIPALSDSTGKASDSPEKVHDAAAQFESLLVAQILRSVRESSGWLGTHDSTTDCAMEMAEQQFATLLAQQGGLGLATLISQGLTQSSKHAPDMTSASKEAPGGLPQAP
jgi:peptidoglycan hydrolase FlgJ